METSANISFAKYEPVYHEIAIGLTTCRKQSQDFEQLLQKIKIPLNVLDELQIYFWNHLTDLEETKTSKSTQRLKDEAYIEWI